MKISIAQIGTNPNSFDENLDKIIDSIKIAEKNKADIVITPELSLCGYLVKDLVYDDNFIHKNLQYLQGLAHVTSNLNVAVLVGFIDRNYGGTGKKYHNCAALIKSGVVQGIYRKQLLPFYDIFDEPRYFQPGTEPFIFELNGKQCGVVICEDLWSSDKGQENNEYNIDPITQYKDKVDYLFSLNASPWFRNKEKIRQDIFEKLVSKFNKHTTLIYCNTINGQDELIFDGGSLVINGGNNFAETLVHLDNTEQNYLFDSTQNIYEFKPQKDYYDILRSNLVLGLKDYIKKCGFKHVTLGVSGGLDSAVVLALACEAIGSENVTGIIMPTMHNTSKDQELAQQLHKQLGCNEIIFPIDALSMRNDLNSKFKQKDYNDVADQNIQARLRDVSIMHFSNAYNWLPLATGNKTEAAIGFYTVFDMNLGFAPIIDLYKKDVIALAKLYKLPQEIITRKPTAALKQDQFDEDDLLPYQILDEIVFQFVEKNISVYNKFVEKTKLNISEKDYNKILKLILKNEFKRRNSTLGLKTTKKAFGNGWRYPICKKN